MTRTFARSATGHVASVTLMFFMAGTLLAGCSAQPTGGATAEPIQAAVTLTQDGLLHDLADIECAAYESGVYNQNEIWGEYSAVAGKYEDSGLIDETEIEVPGEGGTIQSVSLRTVLTSEEELAEYATVGEGATTVRDEVGQEEYDLQTSLFCTVFSHDGVIPADFATANGLTR